MADLVGAGLQTEPEAEIPEALHAAVRDGLDPVLKIGEGGFAEVWAAVDEHTGQEVAIKIIRPDRRRPEFTAKLKKEARMLSSVQSPNIVRVLRRGGPEENPYLALEYIDGVPIAHYVREKPVSEVVRLFVDLVEAVALLHRSGVTHADISPANVLITRSNEVKLIDFGIAFGRDQSLHSVDDLRAAGTKAYTAPELLEGALHQWGPRSDVYALGVLLRDLLGDLPDSSEKAGLEALASRCVEAYDARFESAESLREALRGLEPVPSSQKGLRVVGALVLSIFVVMTVVIGVLVTSRGGGVAEREVLVPVASVNDIMHRAVELADHSDVAGAVAMLERVDPESRDWIWHHLRLALVSPDEAVSLLAWGFSDPHHSMRSDETLMVAMSLDSRRLLASDALLPGWRLVYEHPTRMGTHEVNRALGLVAFSDSEQRMYLLDVANGEEATILSQYSMPLKLESLWFDRDQRVMVACRDLETDRVSLFRIDPETEVMETVAEDVYLVASGHGMWVTFRESEEGGYRCAWWSTASESVTLAWPESQSADDLISIARDEDHYYLGTNEGQICVFSRSGALIQQFKCKGQPRSMESTGTGLLFVSSSGDVSVHDLETPYSPYYLKNTTGVSRLFFDPEDQTLTSTSFQGIITWFAEATP